MDNENKRDAELLADVFSNISLIAAAGADALQNADVSRGGASVVRWLTDVATFAAQASVADLVGDVALQSEDRERLRVLLGEIELFFGTGEWPV